MPFHGVAAVTQVLAEKDSASFGWGHAGATPGDPGQHNTTGGVTNTPGLTASRAASCKGSRLA